MEKDTELLGGITEFDRYLFGEGTHYEIYKKLGAHKTVRGKEEGIRFAVWAPHAKDVFVVGDFNDWNTTTHKMEELEGSGIYQLFIPFVPLGSLYKFYIITSSGEGIYKTDPFGNRSQLRPETASCIVELEGFQWKDQDWLDNREREKVEERPISIYEVHPGSWKKHPNRGDGFYSYKELAHELTNYILEMGYTHVELMGIMEHPYDGSWGYQVTGYYAPTSRYGTPKEFMYFVDYLHHHGIGVILDWVPAHFPKDAHGLSAFDGEPLYEYSDKRKGEHASWGTKVFDYGKREVCNFLIGSALFWLEIFHIDGLRVDAVASMLYLDYGRESGEWCPNEYGENKNLDAVAFLKHLNSVCISRNQGVMIIAEESTAWPKVTGKVQEGGLGFTFKWNMGWMNDFLEYQKMDPYFRQYHHNKMTFSMSYAYSEKYMLVLSHDEVVHLKKSMVEKLPGSYEDKFANLKVAYTFMMGHPGKKLLFMGQEFGQLQEWSEKRELDWYLLADEKHRQLQGYVKKLLEIYKKYPANYELDDSPKGFAWVQVDDRQRSIFSFIRYSKAQGKFLLFICNFTPVDREEYRVGVPEAGTYEVLLETHETHESKSQWVSKEGEWDGYPHSIHYPLKGYGAVVFAYEKQ